MAHNMAEQPTRCAWAAGDPVMAEYHDHEWGVPLRDSRALWELLMLEGFQAGLSWRTILHRRPAFRAAFKNFDPEKIARFSQKDIARLLANPGIIRSRTKIESTIHGAKLYVGMQQAGEDFAAFIWSLAGGEVIEGDGVTTPASTPLSTNISAVLKKRGFKFVGPVIVQAWLQAAGIINDHAKTCFRR